MNRTLLTLRACSAALLAGVCLLACVPDAAAAESPVQSLRKQARDGKIDLSTIAFFKGTPLADIVLTGASVDSEGSCLGKFTWGKRTANVLLQRIAPSVGLPYYVCVLGTPGSTLADHLPGLAGSPADQFELQTPLLALSSKETSIESSDMTPEVKAYWAKMYKGRSFTVRINRGVTFLGAASAKAGSAVAKVLAKLGLGSTQLQLEGVLLNDYNLADLKTARKEGKLKNSLKSGLALRATLAGLKLKGLPKGATIGSPYIEITGTPSLSVGFKVEIPNGGKTHRFAASCRISKGTTGVDLTFNAASESTFTDAFGIRGLDIDRVALQLGVDTKLNVSFGLAGDFKVGDRTVKVAGKMKVNTATGVPTDVALKGEVSKLGLRDLVTLANKIGGKVSPGSKPLSAAALPDVELQDVAFTFAPQGGDSDLGIEKGLACKGQLFLAGSKFAFVDAYLDMSGKLPLVRIKAASKDVDLMKIKLKNASVDVLIAPSLDAHFKVKGSLSILGTTRSIDADISKDRAYLKYSDRIDGVYESVLEFSSPSKEPFWTLKATAKVELMRTLETRVAGEIDAWRKKADKDLREAQNTLEHRKLRKSDLEKILVDARKAARRDYDKYQADVRAATGKVDAARARVDAEQKKLNSLKAQYDAAYKARKDAPWYRKADLWAKEAALFTALNTARGSFEAARGVLDAARGVTKEGGGAVGWVALGPESHPLVVKAKLEIATTNDLITAAQKLVEAARVSSTESAKAAAWVARNAGKIFMVDEMSLTVKVGGKLDNLKDSSGTLAIKYRWMGDNKSYRGTLAVKDFGPDVIKGRILAALKIK